MGTPTSGNRVLLDLLNDLGPPISTALLIQRSTHENVAYVLGFPRSLL